MKRERGKVVRVMSGCNYKSQWYPNARRIWVLHNYCVYMFICIRTYRVCCLRRSRHNASSGHCTMPDALRHSWATLNPDAWFPRHLVISVSYVDKQCEALDMSFRRGCSLLLLLLQRRRRLQVSSLCTPTTQMQLNPIYFERD